MTQTHLQKNTYSSVMVPEELTGLRCPCWPRSTTISSQRPNQYEAVELLQLFHTKGREAFPESSKPDRNTALLGRIRDLVKFEICIIRTYREDVKFFKQNLLVPKIHRRSTVHKNRVRFNFV